MEIKPIELYTNYTLSNQIANALIYNAKRIIEKAKIIKNIEQAINLREQINQEAAKRIPEKPLKKMQRLNEFYNYMLDDLCIISAYEMYSKAILLKNNYIIHLINKPNNLKKQQKKDYACLWAHGFSPVSCSASSAV